MTEEEVAEAIQELIELGLEDEDYVPSPLAIQLRRIESYEEAGILTTDAGFVLTLDDGSQFQTTIKRSR